MSHAKSGLGKECDCECCQVADALQLAVQKYLNDHEDSSNLAMAGGLAKLMSVQLVTAAVGARLKLPDGDMSVADSYTVKDVDKAVRYLEDLMNSQIQFFNRLRAQALADPMKAIKMPERTM